MQWKRGMKEHDLDEKITIVPHDKAWTKIYKQKAERIQKKLGSLLLKIEHIGSTAVSNICAKPIIDIMIGVENITSSKPVVSKLIELRYIYFGEANVPGRLYFRLRGKKNFNLALCQYDGEIWRNNVLFRDYLRSHQDIARQYSQIKKNAIDAGVDTLLKYSEIKQDFINKIIANIVD